jgi:ADP-ribose pyrophosphatase YjhB (NUDIX family)
MERDIVPNQKTLLSSTSLPFVPAGTKTYGFSIKADVWIMDDGSQETYYKYCMPDGVQVVAITPDNQIIAITEWQPNVGIEYTHVIGETMKKKETSLEAARRGLLEETGYESDELIELCAVLENSGKSDRLIHLVLARNCVKTGAGETGITVKLFSPADFWEAMMNYFFVNPESPHGGGNTLKAIALAYQQLGWLKIAVPNT